MGLLAQYRRPWALVALCLLAVPMLVQILQSRETVSEDEARVLSPAPALPRSWHEWFALPRALDRFFGDNFGFRTQLVRGYGALRYAILVPADLRVIIGRDKWLFLNGDGTIEQATGQLLRTAAIEKFADRAAKLQDRLGAQHTRLLIAIPPNSSTINRSRLPGWASTKPAVTEYDLMMHALAAPVDLRPPLMAANSIHPTYRRTDTHWNKFGALIAYDAVVEALHQPDWMIDPNRVLRGFEAAPGGDLARLLAVSSGVTDEDAIETSRGGPTVVVIGDSFTRGFWNDYFSLHAGKYVWIHHEECGFFVSVVETYHPDIVILAPVERQMFCAGN